MGGGVDAQRYRQHIDEEQGTEGEQDRQPQSLPDQVFDLPLIAERLAKIPVYEPAGPVEVTLPQRLIQSVAPAQRFGLDHRAAVTILLLEDRDLLIQVIPWRQLN